MGLIIHHADHHHHPLHFRETEKKQTNASICVTASPAPFRLQLNPHKLPFSTQHSPTHTAVRLPGMGLLPWPLTCLPREASCSELTLGHILHPETGREA